MDVSEREQFLQDGRALLARMVFDPLLLKSCDVLNVFLDAPWVAWLEHTSRYSGDFIDLLKDSEVKYEIHIRALCAMLSVDDELLPESFRHSTYESPDRIVPFIRDLPVDLIDDCARILCALCTLLDTHLYCERHTPQLRRPYRNIFNGYLRELLPRVSDELAPLVFSCYGLDSCDRGVMEYPSVYPGFGELLCDPEVSDKWKREADDMMIAKMEKEEKEAHIINRGDSNIVTISYVKEIEKAMTVQAVYDVKILAGQIHRVILLDSNVFTYAIPGALFAYERLTRAGSKVIAGVANELATHIFLRSEEKRFLSRDDAIYKFARVVKRFAFSVEVPGLHTACLEHIRKYMAEENAARELLSKQEEKEEALRHALRV